MSKLDELIQKLCPDGVKFYLAKDLVKLNNYHQLGAAELESLIVEDGDIPLLPSSRDYDWFTTKEVAKDVLCYGEVFTMGRARHANTKYVNGYFVSANNFIIETSNPTIVSTRFLYHYVTSKISEFYIETSTYPKFDSNLFKEMKIPVPPREVQDEIVHILDNFTEFTAELTAELTARKQQFEHYKDDLFSFNGDLKLSTIDELAKIVTKQTGFDYSSVIKPSLKTVDDGDCIPYMQTKNFTGIKFDYNTDYYVPNEIVKKFPKITLDEKCVLFSIVGASIGNVGLFPNEKNVF